MKPFFISTSIPYPNGNPHIGHATEYVQADFLARYYRLKGDSVFFLTGLDEHGLKIQRTAEKQGVTEQAFVDGQTEVFKRLAAGLSISYDRFIRTTEPDHLAVSQALWQICTDKGDIYKKNYRAWYDVKEEEFLGLINEYPDPSVFNIDPRFIEKIEEENYFFALSKYKDQIVEILSQGIYKVVPESRLKELLNFIETHGLDDISISREKSKLSWGIPVPGDDSQVMYVWFDALTNYLSAVSTVDGQGNIITDDRWPADLHCIGKDISRFHAFIWPGMLLSAGIELPKELMIHGFVMVGGTKMSKSLGNVVDPLSVIEQYGSDVLRWYLLKEVPTTGDAEFTEDRLKQVFLADLANDFGNLVSRVWTMCQKYCEGKVPSVTPDQVANLEEALTNEKWSQYHELVESRKINEALQAAHQLMVFCNRRIEEQKPWAMAKDEDRREDLNELLYELLEIVRHISLMLKPALPRTVETISSGVFYEVEAQKWNEFGTGSRWGGLVPGSSLGTEQPILFPKSA